MEQLYQAFHDEGHNRLHIWRKKDYTLWKSSLSDGACGWYTIANLHRRAQALPLLNFSDQGGCITGVNILKEVTSMSIVDNELRTKFNNACRWISSGRLSPFNAQDQLSSIDFDPINSDISTAIFITTPILIVLGCILRSGYCYTITLHRLTVPPHQLTRNSFSWPGMAIMHN